jgi:hypothetical protein
MKKGAMIALLALVASTVVYAGNGDKKSKKKEKEKTECCDKTKCCPTETKTCK